MPTYEYQCKECNHTFEELQPMSAAALTTCPSCRKETLARVIGSGAGFIFKGSGFYTTDYKRKLKDKGKGTNKDVKETKSDAKDSSTCTSNPDTCPRCGPDD